MLSDRVVVMNQGRIEQIGAPEEALQAARNPIFVAEFLGRSNLVESRRGCSAHPYRGTVG